MSLAQYFEATGVIGVLVAANSKGIVNTAIYARPHFLDDNPNQVTFVMRDRLTHAYSESNPHAFYVFIEDAEQYKGNRLVFKKVKEESDRNKTIAVRRRNVPDICRKNDENKTVFFVFMKS